MEESNHPDEKAGIDATTEGEKTPSTPGPESVPSEGDVEADLPGVPDEASDDGDNDGDAPTSNG
jgi:hypothetical protein